MKLLIQMEIRDNKYTLISERPSLDCLAMTVPKSELISVTLVLSKVKDCVVGGPPHRCELEINKHEAEWLYEALGEVLREGPKADTSSIFNGPLSIDSNA